MTDYARHEHHDFMRAAGQALADPPLQAALVRLTSTLMAANRRGYAALPDSEKLRDQAKRIKEHTLANLDKYLEQLEAWAIRQALARTEGNATQAARLLGIVRDTLANKMKNTRKTMPPPPNRGVGSPRYRAQRCSRSFATPQTISSTGQ